VLKADLQHSLNGDSLPPLPALSSTGGEGEDPGASAHRIVKLQVSEQ
jgi:hypothetical protein